MGHSLTRSLTQHFSCLSPPPLVTLFKQLVWSGWLRSAAPAPKTFHPLTHWSTSPTYPLPPTAAFTTVVSQPSEITANANVNPLKESSVPRWVSKKNKIYVNKKATQHFLPLDCGWEIIRDLIRQCRSAGFLCSDTEITGISLARCCCSASNHRITSWPRGQNHTHIPLSTFFFSIPVTKHLFLHIPQNLQTFWSALFWGNESSGLTAKGLCAKLQNWRRH